MSSATTAVNRIELASAAFTLQFGARPLAVCDAPGRVNLIGEHIDYAGGSVLPFAIQYGIAIAAGFDAQDNESFSPPRVLLDVAVNSPTKPNAAQLAGARFLAEAVLQQLAALPQLRPAGPNLTAQTWHFCIYADLPVGAGLSSSAALAVATAGAVLAATGTQLAPLAVCELSQAAEQAATGVQCGLMDQYAAMFGATGHAIYFDTVTLKHEEVPLELAGALLATIDSGQSRALATSSYNQRRSELDTALAAFSGDRAELDDLSQPATRRLRHVVYETARVLAAREALIEADLGTLGELLNRSHESLRDLFEVSTPELNLLCGLLTNSAGGSAQPLAWGARLTGAGFGGSVIALLHPAAVLSNQQGSRPIDTVLGQYARLTGLKPTLRLVEPSDGAMLSLDAAAPALLRDWLNQDADLLLPGSYPAGEGQ